MRRISTIIIILLVSLCWNNMKAQVKGRIPDDRLVVGGLAIEGPGAVFVGIAGDSLK